MSGQTKDRTMAGIRWGRLGGIEMVISKLEVEGRALA